MSCDTGRDRRSATRSTEGRSRPGSGHTNHPDGPKYIYILLHILHSILLHILHNNILCTQLLCAPSQSLEATENLCLYWRLRQRDFVQLVLPVEVGGQSRYLLITLLQLLAGVSLSESSFCGLFSISKVSLKSSCILLMTTIISATSSSECDLLLLLTSHPSPQHADGLQHSLSIMYGVIKFFIVTVLLFLLLECWACCPSRNRMHVTLVFVDGSCTNWVVMAENLRASRMLL